MTRFEDLPPVDGEGWLADQGRNFLQATDARISRLRLPNFMAESTRKIQGLGSDLGQMYAGLEQGLSSLPSQAQQASTNFLTSTTGRISGLGSQIGSSVGQGLGAIGSTVGSAASDLGSGIRGSTDDLTELLERQREDAEQRREEEEERRRTQEEDARRRRDQLGRSVGQGFSDLRSRASGLREEVGQRYEGFQEGLQNVREADAGDIGGALRTGLGGLQEYGRGQQEARRGEDVGFSEAMNRAAQRGGYEDVITPEQTKFFREVGENAAAGLNFRGGVTGVRTLGQDLGALAGRAVSDRLGRLLPGRRAVPPGATPGTPIPNPTTPAERAYNDSLKVELGQEAAALTPEGPAPLAKGSTLATFDDWLSRQRELWTDESARLSDVQAAVRKKLGRDLTRDQNAMVRRRLYAGRQAASDQIIEDELQPILRSLSPGRLKNTETAMELLDDVGRARAIQNQATARAAGQEVGAVAGETALRNTKQALRMRQARLAEALTQQDAADAAYKQAQADLKRVRAEGRRDVLGSQGRGRRRVQRTPQEQARVEAEAQTKLDAARQGTVDARAARDEAAKGANVSLSSVTPADLKRMRLEWETDAARMAKEAELAEGAATKGAEAAAARRYSGGVTGVDYDEDAVWEGMRLRVADRLGPQATPQEVDEELAAVREATERLQGYSRQLRARLHEAGILSDELYEQWERDFPGYLRTNILKFMDEEAATPAAAGAQRFTVQSLVGGGQDVGARMSKEGTHALREQPVNTLVRMTYAAETLARRNQNAQALKRLVEADPSGDLAKAFRPLKPGEAAGPKEAVFSVYENGEPQRFAVDKRFESLFNLPPSELRNGLDALGQFGLTGTFKAAVTTYNPAFIALNAMRDYLVYLRREAKNPVQALGATRDLLRAYRDVGGAATGRARLGRLGETPRAPGARTEDLREAIRLGGGQDAGYAGLTPQQVRQRLLQEPDVAKRATVVSSLGQVGEILGKLRGGVATAADVGTKATGVQALGRTIRGTGAVVEGAPRLAAYRRALARGATKDEAALAMRDVTMDFSRGGTRARDVNKAIPFFNAAIQGAARFYGDDLVNRKAVTGAQGLGLVVAKVGLDQYNQSYGDDYADVPDYLKDTGLIFMLPGDVEPERRADGTMVPGQRNFLWYPLPQDMAGIIKVGAQAYRRATGEKAYGFDTGQGWLETVGDVAGGLSPVDFEGGLPLPPLFRQLTEQVVNKDIFRDRPIVPEYLEGRPPEQQATPQTSALGRVVGGALGRVSPLGPTRVDYGVTGLLGGTGRQVLAGSDVLARAVGREDLASRPYSSPEEQGALDAVRGAPVVGPTVGAVVRQGGGEIDRREAQLLEREITDAQRAVTERLRAMPSFQRRSPDEQEALLRQEHDKIRRRLEEQGREARTQRQGLRARAQYRD